ncbi:MAG: DUF362 domain-containing protein [Deltaproteobacteria bacterium]|jgi:hypothetical protein|nr:DUF362 domain-containing protein [Deltaproteobacteria bacterium]
MDPSDLKLGLVRQIFPPSSRPDIPATLASEFQRTNLAEKIKPGQKVVVTSGSRGIESMLEVVRAVVKLIKGLGAEPLILPAMGSHGGGTPEGQADVLRHLGQTEKTLGARILTDYKPTVIGEVFGYLPLSVDGQALPGDADHVVLVGRVKEHSEFIGPVESGLMKMAVVGIGRVQGATMMHQAAVRHTYYKTIVNMARVIFQKAPVLCGVALVEDERNILSRLEVVPTAEIERREPELLTLSQKTKPKLPWDALDVLLVDEMGKDISGAGLDTKVVGRIMNIYELEPESPKITRLVTFRISRKGGGNAIGLGLNDYITRELYDAIDPAMTDLNCTVAVSPEKGRCPLVRPTALSALEGALATVGPCSPADLRMAWIANTKDLEHLAVSPRLYFEAASDTTLERLAKPQALPLLPNGYFKHFNDWLAELTGRPAAGPAG